MTSTEVDNERHRLESTPNDRATTVPFKFAHQWQPLPLVDPWSVHGCIREADSLRDGWLNFKRRREEFEPNAYKIFLERFYRRWAIGTGMIDGNYYIDPRTTLTMVEKGLSVDLISPSATNKAPHDVIKILQDHHDAAEFVTESIHQNEFLDTPFLKELHQRLLRNQEVYFTYDQFGNRFEKALNHGQFRLDPRNLIRPSGEIHEFCPPIHVERELEILVESYNGYMMNMGGGMHLLESAAWLHHRFTQIQPFEYGNGHVARALLNWHLGRWGYLPIVISRDDKPNYIDALVQADAGDLKLLIRFIVELERKMILEALDADATEPEHRKFTQLLEHVAHLARGRVASEQTELQSVNDFASELRDYTKVFVDERAIEIELRMNRSGFAVQCTTNSGCLKNRSNDRYQSQVLRTARQLRYWVNSNEPGLFVNLSINPENEARTPDLVFVVSLHHVGSSFTGMMTATAFAQIVDNAQDRSSQNYEIFRTHLNTCSPQMFAFSSDSKKFESLLASFNDWLQDALTVALTYWGEHIERYHPSKYSDS